METIINVNNKTMRTKEELLNAVNLSLDDDNTQTPLTMVRMNLYDIPLAERENILKYLECVFNNNY